MPPGTGDIALTLSQLLPLTGAVVVCTPQDVALLDAVKAIAMFRKVHIPLLGMVENMSYFLCPDCGKRYDIFGSGGAKRRAAELDVPFLGEVPINIGIRERGDAGDTAGNFDDEATAAFFRDICYATGAADQHVAQGRAAAAEPDACCRKGPVFGMLWPHIAQPSWPGQISQRPKMGRLFSPRRKKLEPPGHARRLFLVSSLRRRHRRRDAALRARDVQCTGCIQLARPCVGLFGLALCLAAPSSSCPSCDRPSWRSSWLPSSSQRVSSWPQLLLHKKVQVNLRLTHH